MFVIQDDLTFTWPVDVNVPADGGKAVKQTLKARFEAIDQDELNRLIAEGGDEAVLARVWVGWEDVVDAEREPVPFSAEMRQALCKRPYLRAAVVATYLEAISGRRAKN